MKRIVIESPLKPSGQWTFNDHRRYALWCCRHMYESGYGAIASHLIFPFYLDDRVDVERAAGIDMPWVWQPDVPHYFFEDLGVSQGMTLGRQRCVDFGIEIHEGNRLPPGHWAAFLDGQAPPHTPGFEMCVS